MLFGKISVGMSHDTRRKNGEGCMCLRSNIFNVSFNRKSNTQIKNDCHHLRFHLFHGNFLSFHITISIGKLHICTQSGRAYDFSARHRINNITIQIGNGIHNNSAT